MYFNDCMDDCISCGKSSLLLTSDQQEHLLLQSEVEVPWTGHSSWTHSSVRESVISSAGWSCISHTHTTLSEVYVKKKKKKKSLVKMTQVLFCLQYFAITFHAISRNITDLK